MSDVTSSIPKQKLEELRVEISTWRSQKTSPQQKVPEEIWSKLDKVAPHFNLKTLVETLKLDAKQIRKRNLAVGSQVGSAKSDTKLSQRAGVTAATNKTSTSTAKSNNKTANAKPKAGKGISAQKNQQTNQSAKKNNSPRTAQSKLSRNINNTNPQAVAKTQAKTGKMSTNRQANQKPRIETAVESSKPVKRDNLYPVEVQTASGTHITVRLPWQELLQFVKQVP